MKKYGIKIAFILIGISLSACNGTPTTTNNQKLEEREEHHEEGGNLTTLTQAQIQTVDIRLGHIEEKSSCRYPQSQWNTERACRPSCEGIDCICGDYQERKGRDRQLCAKRASNRYCF